MSDTEPALSRRPEAAPPPRLQRDDARRVFSPAAIQALRAEIEAAGGVEVFFLGRADERGIVVEVEVASRGNEGAAPAIVARADGADLAIHNHPSGVLLPSDADLAVASELGNRGVGFAIISNDAARANLVVPILRRREVRPVEASEVEAVLGPRGSLAARFRGYESRPGQLDMAREVARALAEEKVALLEAGTGTGKTFAYLVPAVLWARRNGEKVVVSTGTIPLQEQILAKDIPALAAVLPKFQAALVKGRSNYVSLRRAEEAARADAAVYESEAERAEVARLVAWARETRTGDRNELSPPPSADAWERVESQSDNCLRARCPRYANCHYFESRRAASRADVIVANHALLVTDLAAKREMGTFAAPAVLPPYQRVIVDEAHHLEEVAADHLGARVTELGVGRLLGRLRNKRDANRGLLPALDRALEAACRGRVEDRDRIERARRAIDERVEPARERAVLAAGSAFNQLAFDARVREAAPRDDAQDPSRERLRELKLRLRANPESRRLVDLLLDVRQGLGILASELEGVVNGLEEALGEGSPALGIVLETTAIVRRLASATASLDVARNLDDAALVRWVRVARDRRGQDRVEVHAAPLDVAPALRAALLEKVKTAVFSSATLTVRGRFDYVARGLGVAGLAPERVLRRQVPSPFDFSRQAVLGVPTDVPDPSHPSFDEATAAVVLDAVRATRGGAFVLFTSYRALTRVHGRLARPLHQEGLIPIRQGEGGRRHLLERFRATRGAVLFGTDSFWEGVDVPGDALVLVLIAKLPFRVPSEPLEQARAEAIRDRGGDPFGELTLPRAVLKLKQGFGRLVRTRTDRGAVVVLDRRIVAKSYGRAFIESLPDVPVVVGPTPEVLRAVARTAGPR